MQSIQLFQFKNYYQQEFVFTERIVGICGRNGVGKTNLLDAVHYLCFTKSYFTRDSLQTKFYHRLEENARIVGGNIIQNNSYNNRIYYEVKRKYLKQLSEGKDHLLRIVKGSKELRYRPELPMPVEF